MSVDTDSEESYEEDMEDAGSSEGSDDDSDKKISASSKKRPARKVTTGKKKQKVKFTFCSYTARQYTSCLFETHRSLSLQISVH